jgi:hypothetical protein
MSKANALAPAAHRPEVASMWDAVAEDRLVGQGITCPKVEETRQYLTLCQF